MFGCGAVRSIGNLLVVLVDTVQYKVVAAWFSRIERPWKLNMEGVTSNKPEINLTLCQGIFTSSKISSLIMILLLTLSIYVSDYPYISNNVQS